MPEFTYTALAKDGHKESAVIQAPNITVAGHLLKEQGLLPTEISEHKKGSAWEFLKTFSSISLKEKIGFIQNLGIMMKASISVSRSLQILAKQTRNPRFKIIISDIHTAVESGKGLSEALSKFPGVFSNIFVSMVRVGEISGNLEKSLEYLTVQLQREEDLKSKTKGAMIYPSVIVGAMVIIGVVMSIYVLPKLTSVFKDFGGELPYATKVLMTFADFMQAHAIMVVVLLVALVLGFLAGLKTPPGKRALDFFLLHFYIINTIVKKINLARYARILSSLLNSGVPIVQSLEVSSDSMGNTFYKDLTAKAAGDVRLGKALSDSLGKDTNLFPILVVQMLQVGEESGTVATILEQIADHYEEEVDTTLRNMSSIIEPLLLLVIGGVVGMLAYALIIPIYSIGQNIQ